MLIVIYVPVNNSKRFLILIGTRSYPIPSKFFPRFQQCTVKPQVYLGQIRMWSCGCGYYMCYVYNTSHFISLRKET
jgi:hypothetical protein